MPANSRAIALVLLLLVPQARAAVEAESIEALRAMSGQRGGPAEVRGYYRAGDGGGGRFDWDAGNTANDNGGTVIKPASGNGPGRWVRAVADKTIEVRWFGARGDGSTDDLPAIQAAATAALSRGGGRLHAAAGTYLVRPRAVPGPRVINLSGAQDLVVEGEGGATTFKLDPGFPWATSQPDAHVFLCVACRRVTFRDFRIDGSGDAILAQSPKANAQMHGIYLSARPVAQQRGGPSGDITIEGIHFRNLRGDGVYGIGDENGPVYLERVTVTRCLFERNRRSGTAWQRRTRFIDIRRNVFLDIRNQAIDTEATGKSGAGAGEDYVIEANVFEHVSRDLCVSVSGISAEDRVRRVKVARNVLLNCGMQVYRAQDVEIARNVIVGSPLRRAVHGFRALDGITFAANVVVNRDQMRRPAVFLEGQREGAQRLRVAGNVIDNTLAPGADGIAIEKATGGVEIAGNGLIGPPGAAVGVRAGSEGEGGIAGNVRSRKPKPHAVHAQIVRELDARRPAGDKPRE